MPEIELIVQGKVDGATEGLKKVEKELTKTALAANKLDSTLAKTSVASNQAGQALNNLGRIAQDAPFGFIGITNNINPMLESFQRLKASTGTTGAALKAMAAGLAGPAGLGLAVSAVSSLLVVFGDRLFSQKKQTDLAKIAVNEYAQAMQKAFEAAGKQVAQVSQIVAALQSENTTLAQRKKLLEDLNGINSTYFGGLKLEHGAVTGLADAYQRYAENIFKVAKAKAAQEQIQKLSTDLVSVTDQINQLTNQLSGTGRALSLADASRGIDAVKKDFEDINKILKQDVISLKDFALFARITGLSEQKINELLSQRRSLRSQELRDLAQISDLSKLVATNDLGSIVGNVKPEKIKEKLDKDWKTGFNLWLRSLQIDLNEFQAKIPLPVEFEPIVTNDFTKEAIERAIAKAGITQFNERFGFKIPINFEAANTGELAAIFADMEKRIKTFEGNASDILNQLQQELVFSFAEGIGRALAGEDIGSIFGGLFSLLGKALSELGKQMIMVSGIMKTIKVALSSLNPALAAAAGFALIALGGYIQSKAPKLASGGIIPPGYPNDSFPAFLQSNEAVIPLDRINDYLRPTGSEMNVRVTGELRGQTIYLQQQRTARSNNRNF